MRTRAQSVSIKPLREAGLENIIPTQQCPLEFTKQLRTFHRLEHAFTGKNATYSEVKAEEEEEEHEEVADKGWERERERERDSTVAIIIIIVIIIIIIVIVSSSSSSHRDFQKNMSLRSWLREQIDFDT